MLFGDVIAISLSIIGFLLSLQGLWLVAQALWPERVETATRHSGSRSLVCFGVGLPVTAITAFFAAVVARAGTFGQISAFSAALLYLVYANVGVAGFVTHIGRRLASTGRHRPTLEGDRPRRHRPGTCLAHPRPRLGRAAADHADPWRGRNDAVAVQLGPKAQPR